MIINEKLLQRLPPVEVIMLAYLEQNPETTWVRMASELGISLANAKLHLRKLKGDNMIVIKKGERKKVEVIRQ